MGLRSLNNPVSSFNDPYSSTGGDAMNPPPKYYGPVARYGDRAVVFAGYDSANVNTIQYFNTTSTCNASDFGDYLVATRGCRALSGAGEAHRGVNAGGWSDASASYNNEIGYVTIPTPGNATDFGDLTTGGQWSATMSSGTRGVWAARSSSTDICYITIATTGDATDFGDMVVAGGAACGASSETRGLIMGGNRGGNYIDYITIASPGNATDFGDLTTGGSGVRNLGGFSSSAGRACCGGGKNNDSGAAQNNIDYVTIANTGNATDFGDLLSTYEDLNGCSNGTRGMFLGGSSGGSRMNVIQYITISTPGNSTDFGDLLAGITSGGACTGTPS